MYYERLAQLILRAPEDIIGGGPRLDVVSGYASPSAVLWCLSGGEPDRIMSRTRELEISPEAPTVRLLIGMAGALGISLAEHRMYQSLSNSSRGHLEIRYPDPEFHADIHSKVYLWHDPLGRPHSAYSGSANMTNAGLGIGDRQQENVMHAVDPIEISEYFEERFADALDCRSAAVDDAFEFPVQLHDLSASHQRATQTPDADAEGERASFALYNVRSSKSFGPGGGINWGQRDDRDPNQSYAPITAAVSRSGFLPPRNTPFTVHCDDGEILVLRGSSGEAKKHPSGKDLSSVPSNARLGRYLRLRMGLESGQFVSMEDLERYGRKEFTLQRLSDGDYYLDFSVPQRC